MKSKKKRMGLITPLVIFPAGKFKYNTKAKTLSKEKKNRKSTNLNPLHKQFMKKAKTI